MGGGDDAAGDRLEGMAGGLRAGPERARRFTGDVAEGAPEGAEAVPPGLKRISMIGKSVSRSIAPARSIRRVSR